MKKLIDEKVFKDPIHGFIRVDDALIWELIETPEFQRLRRIKQLGGTHIVYPTAEHSRFSHSMGVYAIMRQMIGALNKQGLVFSEREYMILLCAALLHDVGHGPFSHSFEVALGLNHEIFTRRILTEDTKINQLLEAYEPGFSHAVSSVIEKTYPNPLMISLISSQIDADRLDYLLRDSYFTGTPYGQVDLERILRTMRVKDNKIIFKHSGMHALEDYLFSRYQMYWQVYLHDCSRSFNFIIQSLLKRLKALIEADFEFQVNVDIFKRIFTSKHIPLSDYLALDDGTITTYARFFMNETDAILSDLANRLLNRGLLQEFEFEATLTTEKSFEKLKDVLLLQGIAADYYLFIDTYKQAPYDGYGPFDDEKIELIDKFGDVQEISKLSTMIGGLKNASKEKHTVFLPVEALESKEVRVALEALIGRPVHV